MKPSAIKALTSLTKNDYAILYEDVFIATQKQIDQNSFEQLIIQVITALTRRRAYLLPIGADSETIYRQRDCWTYAVFTATLFTHHSGINSISKLEKIIPHQGWQWLQQNDDLFQQWRSFLEGKTTIFDKIIGPNQVLKSLVKVHEDTNKSSPEIKDHFFHWLQEKINNGEETLVNRVELGFFIKIPDVHELYKKENDQHQTLDEIYQHPALVSPTNGPLHQYCLGPWKNRNCLSGIIVKPEGFKLLKNSLEINPELGPDPLANMS